MGRVQRMIRPGQALAPLPSVLFQDAGIDPALLDQPSARVTGDQYAALMYRLMEHLQDEGLAFFSRKLGPGTFAMLARNTLGSTSVRQALSRVCRALSLMLDDFALDCIQDGDITGLRMVPLVSLPPHREFAYEILLVALQRLLDWLRMGGLKVILVEFSFAEPSEPMDHRRVFGCDVLFDQARTIMWFEGASLAAPMRRDSREMREFLSDAARNILYPLARYRSCNGKVREFLRKSRPRWPGLADTAAALNLSPSTLQRRLADESYTFQSVKDEVRRDLAIDLLNSTSRSLDAIAAELGFSDGATFQRAFKEWTGTPAGVYRKQMQR